MSAGAALPKPVGAPPHMAYPEPGHEHDSDEGGGGLQAAETAGEVKKKIRTWEAQEVAGGLSGLSDEGQGAHAAADSTME